MHEPRVDGQITHRRRLSRVRAAKHEGPNGSNKLAAASVHHVQQVHLVATPADLEDDIGLIIVVEVDHLAVFKLRVGRQLHAGYRIAARIQTVRQ